MFAVAYLNISVYYYKIVRVILEATVKGGT